MSDIEQKARELLAFEMERSGRKGTANKIRQGRPAMFREEIRAIIAALTPPEGYVLVPVKITKEIEDVLHESFEYGYPAESTWDLAIHASSPEVK